MKLARAGYLSVPRSGTWQWSYRDGTVASIQIKGGRQAVNLDYRVKASGGDWKPVHQRVPICWTPCRFGGEPPWFVCDVHAKGVYCGRQVAAGRLFACRHCYHLGYEVQRGNPMDAAHIHLARLHRRLGADYNGPDWIPPQRPKWMRQRTYNRLVRRIEAGEERLDVVFTIGAQKILARIDRSEQRRGVR